MNKVLVFVSLLLFLTACKQRVEISMQFKNTGDDRVLILRPLNQQILGITDTLVRVKSDTVYRIAFEVARISPFCIVAGENLIDLVVQPGDRIQLACDMKDRSGTVGVKGSNAEGQMLYNRLNLKKYQDNLKWMKSHVDVVPDGCPEKMEQHYREIQKKEIVVFDSLLQANKIDRAFRDYVEKDITLYYSMTLSQIARLGCQSEYKKEYEKFWIDLYKTYPLDEDILGCRWLNDYAKLYVTEYLPCVNCLPEPRISTERERYFYRYNVYVQNITDLKVLEAVLASEIYSQAINNVFASPDVLDLIESYNQLFPDHPYRKCFAPFIEALHRYQEKISGDFSPGVRFVKNYQDIKTLDELLLNFRGKPVFIDFWFFMCLSCRDQFRYNKPLHEFLRKNGIEMLYVSVDQDEFDGKWKECIKFFDLEGWQVRTSRLLHTNLAGQYGIYFYPTYMLVDKEGNIVLPKAKEPSSGEALYRQILEAL